MPNRNFTPRIPAGSDNEARRFIDTHNILHPARRPVFQTSAQRFRKNGGGFADDYDNTNSYNGGEFVRVKSDVTVDGTLIKAGLYAVPPNVSVPANGTGYQVPQSPEPTSFSAAPNDKVYWKVLVLYCEGA